MMDADAREWQQEQLFRTAHHEAAHFVAGWRMGRTPRIVSIRPGETFTGITIGPDGPLVDGSFALTNYVWEQLAAHRAAIEGSIVADLAGPLGGLFADPQVSGYYAIDEDETRAVRAAAGLASLSPRDRELVVTAEAEPIAVDDDETRAAKMSWDFIGDDAEAAAHVEWLRTVARNLVHNSWPDIVVLAKALLRVHVLAGDDAVAIIQAARKEPIMPLSRRPEPDQTATTRILSTAR